MQQKLLIYSELMNGKCHTLSDIVLQKLCNNFTRFVYKHGDGSRFQKREPKGIFDLLKEIISSP